MLTGRLICDCSKGTYAGKSPWWLLNLAYLMACLFVTGLVLVLVNEFWKHGLISKIEKLLALSFSDS